jgi:hypothetical protein
MPDDTAYDRPGGQSPVPAYEGPRPPMAAHWPAPPGGWQHDYSGGPLLNDGAAATKADLGTAPETATDPFPAGPAGPIPSGPGLAGSPITTGPPPMGSAVPERSRPKHLPIILSIVAGVVLLGLITAAAVGTAMGVHRYRADHKQATVGMDQPVRDGSFQFTADRVQCGVDEIGTPDDYQTPTGQFCVVTLTIKNVGTDPAIFADAIQKAYGPGGVWFGSDSEAAFYANPDPNIFFNDINPGNKVQALVVYDIPTEDRILRLEVHENPTTRGAIIKIG